MRQRLIVVGAGMAAAYLLQELRCARADLDITVIGEEREACYNRVLLSNMLAGESSESDLEMLDTQDTTETLRFLSETRVESVDTKRRRVVTDQGLELAYDHLIIATGASVARPALAGSSLCGVEDFRTLADARKLAAGKRGRAVVVGGGLLGLEAAHGLNTLGFTVTVVHRQPYLMNRQLDEAGARQLQLDMESGGIAFRLGDSVASLDSVAESLSGVVLYGGETLPCELLLFATGINPNVALVKAAGVACDRGVLIDSQMRTSSAGVYALGECSQLGRHCFGLVAPIREQAKVLAREMSGVSGAGFAVGNWPTQLKISGIEIYSAGDLDAGDEQLLLRDDRAGIYRRLVLRGTSLVGAVLVGDKRGGSWYSELISSGADISAFRSGLMFGREVSEAMQVTVQAA